MEPYSITLVFACIFLQIVDGVYVYQTSFGLASGQVLHRSQGTLLPLSVNTRYRISGTMCNARSNLIKLRTL
jgi:hypothetical protein